MLDREPDNDAARTAAEKILTDAALSCDPSGSSVSSAPSGSTSQESTAHSTSSKSSSASLLANRDALARTIALGIGAASYKAAQRWGAHWMFTGDEALNIGHAALDVADLYVSSLDGPWERLAVAVATPVVLRFLGPKLPPLPPDPPPPKPTPATSPAPAPADAKPEPAQEVKAAA